MMNTFSFRLLASVLVVMGCVTLAHAQANEPANWADSLRQYQEEHEQLLIILRATESLDTSRQNQLVMSIIKDRDIRARVISALRKSGKNVPPNTNAELEILQKPEEEGEILSLTIDNVRVFGSNRLRAALGDNLYTTLIRGDYEHVVLARPKPKTTEFIFLDASLFGATMLLKSGFGIAAPLGNDLLGYPFWLSGHVGVLANIKRPETDFKIGLLFPLESDPNGNLFGLKTAVFAPRRLEGSTSLYTSLDQLLPILEQDQQGQLRLGAAFQYGFTPSITQFDDPNFLAYRGGSNPTNPPSARPDGKPDSTLYIGLAGHLYVTYFFPDQGLKGVSVGLGGGYHQINAAVRALTVTKNNSTTPIRYDTTDGVVDRDEAQVNRADLYVRIAYDHKGDDEYGVALQYNNTFLASAYYKFFSWLSLEAKFTHVLFRPVDPWDPGGNDPKKGGTFFAISPRITFNF